MTLSGLNFNLIDLTASASLEPSVSCTSASWITTSMVACAATSYRGSTVRIGMTMSTVVGTGVGLFSFDGAHAEFLPTARAGVCSGAPFRFSPSSDERLPG